MLLLKPDANVEVVLHELGHHVFLKKGMTFQNRAQEEREANIFAKSEADQLGIRLEPYESYKLDITADNPMKLYTAIAKNQVGLGLSVKSYRVIGKKLELLFTPTYPVPIVSNKRFETGTKYLIPIIWAIIALAGIAGIFIINWQLQHPTEDFTKIVTMVSAVAVLGISAWVITSLLKA